MDADTSKQLENETQINEDKYVKKMLKQKTIKSFVFVTIGSILYAIGVVWVLQLGEFFSNGVTGATQILVRLPELFGKKSLEQYMGLLIGIINIPLIILSWNGVSKRYAMLSLLSTIVISVTTTILTTFTISPVVALLNSDGAGLIEAIQNGDLNIFAKNPEAVKAFRENIEPGTRIILAILGGAITGFGAALCLKVGGSTGGIDVIASYIQMKKRGSFTKAQSVIDCTIIVVSSIFSVEKVLYTLIRLYIHIKIVDLMFTNYKIARIEVITNRGEELRQALIKEYHHGVTIFSAIGGYTLQEKQVLEMYISAYEIHSYMRTIKTIDPGAFIVFTKVKILGGKYIQKTIV